MNPILPLIWPEPLCTYARGAPSFWLRERRNSWAMKPPDPLPAESQRSGSGCALAPQEVF